MHSRRRAAVVLAAAVAFPLHAAAAPPDEATLLRVFLIDGTSLVSYGEPARVNDRVIFSMPTAAMPNPPLHLVNLPIARVDWERTSRYAATARASHYVETQAENDYAALANDVAPTLNEVALTAELDTYTQLLVNVQVRNKRPLEELDGANREIRTAQAEFGDAGRILVRFSGTEPLARVMVEGPELARVEHFAHSIAAAIQAELGE